MEVGMRFGRLVVLSLHPDGDKRKCLAKCDCGKEKAFHKSCLRSGNTRSCGCLHREVFAKIITKHGMSNSKSPEYTAWKQIKQRCYNPNCERYKDWGGRGITVCDRWLQSFDDFLKDVGPKPTRRHSIERIDHDGNYEPGNVMWLELEKQSQNRRNSIMITWDGETHCLSEWAIKFNMKIATLYNRYHSYGMRPPKLFANDDQRSRTQRQLTGDKNYTGRKHCKIPLGGYQDVSAETPSEKSGGV